MRSTNMTFRSGSCSGDTCWVMAGAVLGCGLVCRARSCSLPRETSTSTSSSRAQVLLGMCTDVWAQGSPPVWTRLGAARI